MDRLLALISLVCAMILTAAYPRGPICYHCNYQVGNDCTDTIQCGRDEVCMSGIRETATGTDHLTRCMEKSSCYLAAHAVGMPLGRKRSVCFNCCETDLCNSGCSGGLTTTTTIAPCYKTRLVYSK